MKIGRLKITGDRWPWQPGYNWRGTGNPRAPLNRCGARFGGGWKWKIGIDVGGHTVILNLFWGMLRIELVDK